MCPAFAVTPACALSSYLLFLCRYKPHFLFKRLSLKEDSRIRKMTRILSGTLPPWRPLPPQTFKCGEWVSCWGPQAPVSEAFITSSLKETFSGFGLLDRRGFLFLRAPLPPHLLFTQGLHPCGCPLTRSTLVGGEEVGAAWEAVLCRGGRGAGVPGGTSVTFGPGQAICARAAPR